MRGFMDYILEAYTRESGGSRDNDYSRLNETANELLNFRTPRGLRLTLSSLATPQFATSYELGTVGVVDGSISYLYSTIPLTKTVVQSDRIPLTEVLRSYRPLTELPHPASSQTSFFLKSTGHTTDHDTNSGGAAGTPTTIYAGERSHRPTGTLMYGRLYLPKSMLEALVAKHLTPALQVRLIAVSQEKLRQGGTLLGLLQYDDGRYGLQGLASTDGGLLGVRGVYNFGGDVSPSPFSSSSNHPTSTTLSSSFPTSTHGPEDTATSTAASPEPTERDRERIYGRFSAGGELYYGTLNKSGGMSLGARFATLPSHRGTPLTATLTVNPLMGNISATYAVVARRYCSLATRMEFNVYSYESDWAVGMELWSKRRPVVVDDGTASPLGGESENPKGTPVMPKKRKERSFQAKLEWRLDDPDTIEAPRQTLDGEETGRNTKEEEYLGVLKARLDQHFNIGLLWEGRVKSLLFSLGTGIDPRRLDQPFRTLGLEVQFSS